MSEKGAGGERLPQLVEPGLWIERHGKHPFRPNRRALFLDRDGTLNVDTGYPRDPEEIVLLDLAIPVIRAANSAGMPVVVVTNQSGVARGLFSPREFAAVHARVLRLLEARGCSVDLTLACFYHESGQGPLGVADHPMRKPRPGMLLRAAEILAIDLTRSAIVGDSASDMAAGAAASLERGFFIGGGPLPEIDGFPIEFMGAEALAWIEAGC